MLFWRLDVIAHHMDRKGWTNARQLALGADIGYPAAWAIQQGAAIGKLDSGTLDALVRAFGLNDPWTLLRYELPPKRRKPPPDPE